MDWTTAIVVAAGFASAALFGRHAVWAYVTHRDNCMHFEAEQGDIWESFSMLRRDLDDHIAESNVIDEEETVH